MVREISLEDLDIYILLRDIIRNIWVAILAAGIIMMGAGVYIEYTYVPKYQSQVTFVVSTKDNYQSSVFSNLSTAIEMAKIFTGIMDSDILREKAAIMGGLDELPGSVAASVIPETNLLLVSVTSNSPEEAFKALKLITENYTLVSDYIYGNAVLDIIDEPEMPYNPVNHYNKREVMKKAGIIGFCFMTLVIAIMSFLRDTVKNERAVKRKLDVKLLSCICHESKNKTLRQKLKKTTKCLLITNPLISFRFVEEYQRLGTKIENISKHKNYKTILITSVCENEGKSTVCANIALALAERGKKVLLIDADFRKPSLYKIFDSQKKEVAEVGLYLEGKCSFEEILYYNERTGLYELFGKKSYENSAEFISGDMFEELLNICKKEMDHIIIDSPPLSVLSDSEILAEKVDASILVIRQDHVYAQNINDAIDLLNQSKSELLECVLNNIKSMPFSNAATDSYGYRGYYYKHQNSEYRYIKSSEKIEGITDGQE